ncbi:hypothetical protein PCE1_001853 [Barthelona sp. PCE]
MPIEVYAMMPLDMVNADGSLKYSEEEVDRWFAKLATAQHGDASSGMMIDVCWGLIENDRPKKYNEAVLAGYDKIFSIAEKNMIPIQIVLSTHKIGGNVGDSLEIPLPPFVTKHQDKENLFYVDILGSTSEDFISWAYNNKPIDSLGRTPLDMYQDYANLINDRFVSKYNIIDIAISVGPASELRYPSYQLNKGWDFPGVGSYCAYSDLMKEDLKSYAAAHGVYDLNLEDLGLSNYNDYISDPTFYSEGKYLSQNGEIFLKWYFNRLVEHGEAIIKRVAPVFPNHVAKHVKVSGIHWFAKEGVIHGAEMAAGYIRVDDWNFNPYAEIAEMLSRNDVNLAFTCAEMRDYEQPEYALSSPENLVRLVQASADEAAAMSIGVENALQRFDQSAFDTVFQHVTRNPQMRSVTWLRWGDDMEQDDNFNRYKNFIKRLGDQI